ncbi:hypothetical protein B0H16DRAFT_1459403 [Mycena metata]|uniref:ARM repeat-containing protein n=1 Tax=Mycena metata TaxID=1033252 RepID=A0AAD7IYZ3_9AGAR|nr:hypothetical protein B0H16DRAFT_1459403 [Mycena metata]
MHTPSTRLFSQLDLVLELLDSTDAKIRRHTCELLGILASLVGPDVWHSSIYARVLDTVSDEDAEVQASGCAMKAAIEISLRVLAQHVSGNVADYQVGLKDRYIETGRHAALLALSSMNYRLNGAQAIAETDFLECLPELLISSETDTLRWTCQVLRNLVFHGLVPGEKLGVRLSSQILFLLRYEDEVLKEIAPRSHQTTDPEPKFIIALPSTNGFFCDAPQALL